MASSIRLSGGRSRGRVLGAFGFLGKQVVAAAIQSAAFIRVHARRSLGNGIAAPMIAALASEELRTSVVERAASGAGRICHRDDSASLARGPPPSRAETAPLR